MPTVPVTIHLPTRRIPAKLSTDRPESSHGQPVLVMEGGGSYPEGQSVAFGPADVTDLGLAADLLLLVESDPESERLLARWTEAGMGFLRRHGLQMAVEWLYAGEWHDGSEWTQEGGDGVERNLLDELDGAPLDREVVRHVTDDDNEIGVEGTSWTFPDGSGVVEVGDGWISFDSEGRTDAGCIVRRADRERWTGRHR